MTNPISQALVVFDARALARDIIESTPEVSDPHELVDLYIDSIPSGKEIEVLRQLISDLLVGQVGYVRSKARVRMQGRSKASAVRDAWQGMLATLEFDPVTREWMRLGDATRENLLHMATSHVERAVSHQKRAARFEMLADALTWHHKATVSQLPLGTIDSIFAPEIEA